MRVPGGTTLPSLMKTFRGCVLSVSGEDCRGFEESFMWSFHRGKQLKRLVGYELAIAEELNPVYALPGEATIANADVCPDQEKAMGKLKRILLGPVDFFHCFSVDYAHEAKELSKGIRQLQEDAIFSKG